MAVTIISFSTIYLSCSCWEQRRAEAVCAFPQTYIFVLKQYLCIDVAFTAPLLCNHQTRLYLALWYCNIKWCWFIRLPKWPHLFAWEGKFDFCGHFLRSMTKPIAQQETLSLLLDIGNVLLTMSTALLNNFQHSWSNWLAWWFVLTPGTSW